MEKRKSNPLLDSVAEIKKLELLSEALIAYESLQKVYCNTFDKQMEMIVEEIVALQKEAIGGTTFFLAGILLSIAPPEEGDEVGEEDYKHYTKMVMASIHWGILNGYK